MIYYYPSCKFKAAFLNISEAMCKTLATRGIEVVGCCRIDNHLPNEKDMILTVCTSCSLILKETSRAKVMSIWRYLIDSDLIPKNHLKGKKLVIQDCAKADDETKGAVHEALKLMGADLIISKYQDFCGTFFMDHMSKRNLAIAPLTFTKLEEKVEVLTQSEKGKHLKEMVDYFGEKTVIVYCNSCYRDLKKAGANVMHIAELLMEDKVWNI